jgi:uncharacterized protein
MESNLYVSELWEYPIKSAHGIRRQEVQFGDTGFIEDRNYMVIDENGKHVNQKSTKRTAILAAVMPELISGGITVTSPKATPLTIEDRDDKTVEVDVYGTKCLAYDLGNPAAEWFSNLLCGNYRFVKQASYRERAKVLKGQTEEVPFNASFADGYQALITSAASLNDLNTRITRGGNSSVRMSRFRPNIVIGGATPWEEDMWLTAQVGDVFLEIIKPCVRCVITTINQETGERDMNGEPFKTLKEFRTIPKVGPIFGVYALGRSGGTIKQDQKVVVTKTTNEQK